MNSKLNHKSFRGERQGSSQVGKRNTTTMNFGTQAKKKENVVKPEGGVVVWGRIPRNVDELKQF